MASNESENFYRIVSLLVNVGTPILRKLFLKYTLSSSNITTTSSASISPVIMYLVNHQAVLMQLHKKKILRQDQLNLLISQSADPELWDISLLSIILKNICPISATERADIDCLRLMRNTVYGHTSSATMKLADFTVDWQTIEVALQSMLTACNDPVFEKEMLADMQKVQAGPLDIGATVQILKQWYTQEKETEDKLDDISQKLDTLVSQITDLKNVRNVSNPAFAKMKKHTHMVLQEDTVPFVSTQQFNAANQMFGSDHVVVITGGPGDGKSTVARKLLTLNHPTDASVILNEPSQWEHIDVAEVEVVLIDDIFGKERFDEKRQKEWIPILDMLESYIKTKAIKVVIVSRDYIYGQCKLSLARYDMFKHIIETKSQLLSLDEKADILNSFLTNNSILLSVVAIQTCCKRFVFAFGFPLCCQYFVSNQDITKRGELFFATPYEFFKHVCESMSKMEYLTLIFMFYKRNSIPESDLKPTRRSHLRVVNDDLALLRDISEFVDVNPHLVNIKFVRECLSLMTHLFKYEEKAFSFTDTSIYNCVALHYGKTFPDEIIQFCTVDFLCERTAWDQDETTDKLIITKDSFCVLVERVISEVVEKSGSAELVKFPGFSNTDFCKLLIEMLNSDGKTREFLCDNTNSIGEQKDFFIQFFEENTDAFCYPLAAAVAEKLLLHDASSESKTADDGAELTSTQAGDSRSSKSVCRSWKCHMIAVVLEWLCLNGYDKCFHAFFRFRNKDKFEENIMLCREHVTPAQLLLHAVRVSNTDIIRTIMNCIHDEFIGDSDLMDKAVEEAKLTGNEEIIRLVKTRLTDDSKKL